MGEAKNAKSEKWECETHWERSRNCQVKQQNETKGGKVGKDMFYRWVSHDN